jgi:hypothetical protein
VSADSSGESGVRCTTIQTRNAAGSTTRIDTTTLLDALSMAARASARRRSGVVLLRQLSVAAEYFGHVALSRFEARRLVPISMRSTLTSSAAARRSAARLCRRLRSRSGPRSASRALRLAFLCFLMSGEESEPAPKIAKGWAPLAPATLFLVRHRGHTRLCRSYPLYNLRATNFQTRDDVAAALRGAMA